MTKEQAQAKIKAAAWAVAAEIGWREAVTMLQQAAQEIEAQQWSGRDERTQDFDLACLEARRVHLLLQPVRDIAASDDAGFAAWSRSLFGKYRDPTAARGNDLG